ncbi:MAG: hypothetical protein DRQ13_01685 [Ignavibacteriae bacterium]|nr:MAG: hypothetical protein DRQ13_01685 [Ignavibacteriota bacterium]
MDNTADVIMTGEATGDNFGVSVSATGDVNGDGYSDIIVGATLSDAGGNDAGRSYIYFGGTSMDDIADVTMTGDAADDQFGISVSDAGDVNGDGYSDVIVGANLNDAGGNWAGRSYIYFGGASMDNVADVIMTGEASGDFFGVSVSTAGDVNGDGYSDIIVGANGNNAGGADAGKSYIYFGGVSMDNIADVTMTGVAASDNFGKSVSTAGDVNGDGYSDVIVGAYYNDAGGNWAGRSYIYFGGISMDNIADVQMTGEAAIDFFGISVSIAGDVNGDGYSDVIVGAFGNDAGGSDAGRAFLYLNSLTGPDIPDEFFTGESASDFFGISVSTAGDVNGDGYSDVIVGAPYNDAGGAEAGRAYIYFGGASMDNAADITMTGETAGDRFGYSVSTAGDVNGDGYSDIIIGAYKSDAGGTDAGRAYIYFGGTSMDNTADVIMTGEAAGDQLGYSVSTAGDVNGDGYSDIIVSANVNDAGGSNAGRVYIYFGGTSMDNIADVIMTGEAAGDLLGSSVSTAGDVNGDGYSDVIVGARSNDAGGTDAGRSYIYYGGRWMDNYADVTMTGEVAGDLFGYSVSTAGDVNGDGYSDVIVGAFSNNTGGGDAGRSYIYYGGTSMDNSADVTMTGEAASDFFGVSVSTAGDVNRDGYSDIIVGADGNNAGGTNAGKSYIYFGGVSMDNIADVTMTGEVADDRFGHSVSTAGDVNGDGYSDIIVGARWNDAGGNNAGRAYLYLSSSPPIKPRIMSVKDVPFDQGGYVYVNFVRSGYDAKGESNIITEYIVEMSNPPGPTGFSWAQIGSVQPLQNPLYTFIAHTPNDSMTNNSGTYYFRVTARTEDPNQYWRSNIMYGHSVDNLAPLAPEAFYAQNNGSDIKLGWKANAEPDLKNYVIYRTDYPGAEPDTLTPLAQITDTTFIDTNPLPGTSYYYLRAQDINNNLSTSATTNVSALTFLLAVSVVDGWNMVSVPGVNPDGQGVDFWWSGKDPTASVFKYVDGLGYVPVTAAAPTEGYWMKHSGANVYETGDEWPADGIQIVSHVSISATAGWNLIGGYENSAATSGLTTTPPGLIVGPAYGYLAGPGYYIADNLVPGYGYWIKLTADGVINIPSAPLSKGNGEVVEYFKEDWGKITITDNAGRSYTLYAVEGEVNPDNYELPPMPPSGMFDIRYGSGRIAEDINSAIQTIKMTSLEYPITVQVEGMDIRLQDETGNEIDENIKSGDQITISNAQISKLMVTGEMVPDVYSLEQNYPNPFNPSTVIEFSLPEDVSNVQLTIYDILGQRITQLVNTSLKAGKYSYQWNGGTVATGMYIYELRTDKFVSVKKMILMK